MPDHRTLTIRANFDTREAADLAVEHLVQQLGIPLPDVFVQSAATANTSGSKAWGGDAAHGGGTRDDALLAGDVVVSVDIAASELPKVNRIFGDLGAMRVARD